MRGEIHAHLNKPHKVIITCGNTVIKDKQLYVIQEAVQLFHDILGRYIEQGFIITSTTGTHLNEIENIIQQHFICKLQPQQRRSIDVSTCENDSTIILFEPLAEIDNRLIVQLNDKYCFDVNEIGEYIISNKQFINPLSKHRLVESDIQLIINHDKLTKANKTALVNLIALS